MCRRPWARPCRTCLDAKDKRVFESISSMLIGRFSGGFKLTLVLAALSRARASAPWDGFGAGRWARMAQANTGVNTARTHELALNLGRTWHFHIGVTALGALIILGLTALLAVAVRLIVVTRRRAREAEAAQRRLEKEIGERKRVEDEMVALNADLKSKEMETIRAQT